MDPAQERNATLAALKGAADQIVRSGNVRLVPPEGMALAFALRGARDAGGVAAVDGGIRRDDGGQLSAGPCVFGSDSPVAGIVLTAMKFDPVMRSAAILQYSGRALSVLENDLFLECIVPDSVPARSGVSTMDWGIASCCRDGVPDVIVRKGEGDAGSRIILCGELPADVLNNIIICSNRI